MSGDTTATNGEFVRFKDVHKAFGPKQVYSGFNLTVMKGETLTVIGRSGVGKSVMLKLLTGLLPVDRGEIWFKGREIAHLAEEEMVPVRRQISMLFQGAALFDSMNVRENIAYGLREHFRPPEEEIDRRVAEVLDLVGLPGTEHLKPAELSGGMKKRIGLARAIAIQPDVVLYDEPTTGLDPLNVKRIESLIVMLQEKLGVTSIVVTHDMDSAFRITDRIAMIDQGRVIAIGEPESIRHSENAFVRQFIAGDVGED